jgi:glycosyltransferase involved in cell wall biosynthesis
VTVYGNWENQPQHVVPFFTSLLTDEQLLIAQKSALGKSLHNPMRIIYVGRLSCAKNVHILIDAIHRLAIQGVTCECKIIGEGVELQKLIQLSQNLCVSDRVQFMGGMPFEDVISYYQWADVLILVSETEGWPKAIVEGMAFGLVCVGSNRGLVPQILGKGRGLVVEPGDVNQLVDAFLRIRSGWEYAVMSQESAKWSQQYSKKNLQSAIRDLMIKSWKLTDDALLFVDKEVRRDVSANPPLN